MHLTKKAAVILFFLSHFLSYAIYAVNKPERSVGLNIKDNYNYTPSASKERKGKMIADNFPSDSQNKICGNINGKIECIAIENSGKPDKLGLTSIAKKKK